MDSPSACDKALPPAVHLFVPGCGRQERDFRHSSMKSPTGLAGAGT